MIFTRTSLVSLAAARKADRFRGLASVKLPQCLLAEATAFREGWRHHLTYTLADAFDPSQKDGQHSRRATALETPKTNTRAAETDCGGSNVSTA